MKNVQKVRKSDMIQLNQMNVIFLCMGLFKISEEWIHPEITKNSYEIIYVTEGVVYMYEDGVEYELHKGDLLLMRPYIMHRGYQKSTGETSFYWVHFQLEKAEGCSDEYPGSAYFHTFTQAAIFKELLHYSTSTIEKQYMRDITLLYLLGQMATHNTVHNANKLTSDLYEWVRINASHKLTAKKVAQHFQYNQDYLSRIVNEQYSMTLKELINSFILQKANDYLCNTVYTVKQISEDLCFPSANAFVNYYKYHQGITPTSYRNTYTNVIMNNK